VKAAGGFATFEAKRQLRAQRAAGLEPVALDGTVSPALLAHVVDGRRFGTPHGRARRSRLEKSVRSHWHHHSATSSRRIVGRRLEVWATNPRLHPARIE